MNNLNEGGIHVLPLQMLYRERRKTARRRSGAQRPRDAKRRQRELDVPPVRPRDEQQDDAGEHEFGAGRDSRDERFDEAHPSVEVSSKVVQRRFVVLQDL